MRENKKEYLISKPYNARACYGTTEYSEISLICKSCPTYILCNNIKPKRKRIKR